MGRCAKYFTAAEKALASKEHRSRYRANGIQRQKTSRHAPHKLKCIPGLPELSPKIRELADITLPENDTLFQRALHNKNLDESDLDRWVQEPPFMPVNDRYYQKDPHSDESTGFTNSVATVLHGVRLREQRRMDILRRAEFSNGWLLCMEQLRKEVTQLLLQWERVRKLDIYDEYQNPQFLDPLLI
ncbi:hypothetical protein B0H19DRAFT_1061637 [Mycena capillaripes]|nr:hypothetical protein B0H19DRAFT_1061637 [Mycena capillaripes]